MSATASEPDTTRPLPALWRIVVPALVAALFVGLTSLVPVWTEDDAYITFRYSKNLAQGLGPVYNPGERVEGYSNFSWMMLMAAVIKLGGSAEFYSRVFGVASGAALVWLCGWVGATILGQRAHMVVIAPLLLAVFPGFLRESTEGLETSFFSLLLLAGVALAVLETRRPRAVPWFAVVLALASMTRPEGPLVFALVGGCLFVHRPLHGQPRVAWLAKALAVFLVIFVPYFLWRYSYYGYPFPNTYYAKTGGGLAAFNRGLGYLSGFLKEYFWFPLVLGWLFVALKSRRNLLFLLISVVSAGVLVFVVKVGGDYIPSYRFIIPVLPLLCLAFQAACGMGVELLQSRKMRRVASGSLLLLTGLLCVWVYNGSERGRHRSDMFERMGDVNGYFIRWFEENAEPNDVLATSSAGEIAFKVDMRILDMLGLNDLHIARAKPPDFGSGLAGHECGDGEYVLSQKPKYILLQLKLLPEPKLPENMKSPWHGENTILQSPEFWENYEPHFFPCYDQYGYVFVRGT